MVYFIEGRSQSRHRIEEGLVHLACALMEHFLGGSALVT